MRKGVKMDTRVAVISIIVENPEAIVTLNDLLHEAGNYIIGRMGNSDLISSVLQLNHRRI